MQPGEAAGAVRGRFATTHWSLVVAAGDSDPAASREALSRLCSLYWYPIFAFVRRQGHSTDDAQDLTQGFFARVIEKKYFADADQTRGRLRTFLLTACQRFLCDERDRAHALKRGGGIPAVSIDVDTAEQQYAAALTHSDTPERLYERQWCLTLLAAVLEDVRAHYVAVGNERLFERLAPFLTMADDAGTHAEAAGELGMTAAAVKVAVHRLRRRYRDAFRRRVEETVVAPGDVDDEFRHLLEALS